MSTPTRLWKKDYCVGWICALEEELAAAEGMLDEIHGEMHDLEGQNPLDKNTYILGRIHKHNIVITSLPAGIRGITSAATVATDMRRSFESIKIGLLVGIGSAAPSENHDIRLGDVVVSQPSGHGGGVIQFDRGKTIQNGVFQRTGFVNSPPKSLLTALIILQASHEMEDSKVPFYMAEMLDRFPKMKEQYCFPYTAEDRLYKAEYDHPDSRFTCKQCDPRQLVIRNSREDTTPEFHYGNIASSSHVIKHGLTREKLRAEHDVLCFENEAAGLMLDFPCLVIRGICDYADSHENETWGRYAAATAAAFAKELLSFVPAARVREEKAIQIWGQ